MRAIRLTMGMPASVEIADANASQNDVEDVFRYFAHVDEVFSTYKNESEISRFNRREIAARDLSAEMQEVLALAEKTKEETEGFFDARKPGGLLDPSGIVKGWAILSAARLLEARGYKNFYVDAGADIEVRGVNLLGEPWTVGIRNPFNTNEIVKILKLSNRGIATSGTYERGDHIYNPLSPGSPPQEIVSLTVVGPDILEADRFATAAFAMGKKGISFIEKLPGLEGYMIDTGKKATMTSGFSQYV